MASENKKRKLKNSHGEYSFLKNKDRKIKRLGFFNSAQRMMYKKIEAELFCIDNQIQKTN